eukprot:768469-Hanusia_phi.AAC.4
MQSKRSHFVLVPIKRQHRLVGSSEVVELDLLVATSREEPVPVGAPLARSHRVLVRVDRIQAAASPRVPQLHLVILSSRQDQRLVRVPVAAFDVPVMACDGSLLRSCLEVPDLEHAVVSSGHELEV